MKLTKVRKRDQSVAPFDLDKIIQSIYDAAFSTGGFRQDIQLFLPARAIKIYGPYYELNEAQIAQNLALQASSFLMGQLGYQYQQNDSSQKEEKIPSVEQIQDAVENTLRIQGFIDVWEAYRLYRWGRTAVREGLITEEQFSRSGLPDEKCEQIRKWNERHGCDTLTGLDQIVSDPEAYKNLIEASTQAYEEDLTQALETYKKNPKQIVVVAGPSSSGKTTTTKKVVEKLTEEGYRCKLWLLDEYYLGLQHVEQDKFGDYNYETPESLNIELIQKHLDLLLEGETISVPHYDFKKGRRDGSSRKMSLREGDILVVDSLYSFSPTVFPQRYSQHFFRIYIETLNIVKDYSGRKVKFTDNRLLRRMARDSRPQSEGGRDHSIALTLGHWHYVRNEELRSLIPLLHTSHYVVNGGLAFELPILKEALYRKLPKLDQFYQEGRLDAYVRGTRIKRLFNEIKSVSDKFVPEDSLLREFIGRK